MQTATAVAGDPHLAARDYFVEVEHPHARRRHDPQLAARGFFEKIEHVKKGTVVANGIPLGLTGTPGSTRQAGAAMAQGLVRLPLEQLLTVAAI